MRMMQLSPRDLLMAQHARQSLAEAGWTPNISEAGEDEIWKPPHRQEGDPNGD